MSRVTSLEFTPSMNLRTLSVRKLIILIGITAGAVNAHGQISDKDVLDKLILNPNLKTFVNLIAKGDMIETLKAGGPFTIFAPSDAAFAKLPPPVLAALKKDKTILKKFLNFQMVASLIDSKSFKEGPLKTIAGESTFLSLKKQPTLNTGKFISVDDKAANGIIHVVDIVSFPPSLAKLFKPAPTPGTVPPPSLP